MTDIEVADAEAELCRLPDVRAARIVTAGHNQVLEVHVLALPGSSVDELTRQAQASLIALGIRVDRQAISVVQLEQTVPVASRDTTAERSAPPAADRASGEGAGRAASPETGTGTGTGTGTDRPLPRPPEHAYGGNGNGNGVAGGRGGPPVEGTASAPPRPPAAQEDDRAPRAKGAATPTTNGDRADTAPSGTDVDDIDGERGAADADHPVDDPDGAAPGRTDLDDDPREGAHEHGLPDDEGVHEHGPADDSQAHPEPEPEVPAPADAGTGSRVAIEAVLAQRHGLRCTAAVTLRRGDEARTASVEGSAASSATLRLVAEATVSALSQIEPRGRNLAVETATVTRIGERWIAVVTLVLLSSTDEEILTGSAPVRSLGEHEAVVRAVLDASNRRLRLSG